MTIFKSKRNGNGHGSGKRPENDFFFFTQRDVYKRQDLGSTEKAAAFHEFDVQDIGTAVFAGPGGIQVVVDGFVQHDADAAYFAADIGGTFKIPVGEALFHRFDACFFKFLDGIDSVAGAVALVGVYAEADVWAHGFTDEAHGTDIFFYVDSGLDFENVKTVFEDMLTGLFGHEFGGADAYGDVILDTVGTVSYTHLDVYKRQVMRCIRCGKKCR